MFSLQSGKVEMPLLLSVIVLSVLAVGGFFVQVGPPSSTQPNIPVSITPWAKHESLQLHNIPFTSTYADYNVTPPPGGTYCPKDNKKPASCSCIPTEEDVISCPKVNGVCPYPVSSLDPKFVQNHLNECYYVAPGTGYQANVGTGNCREYCIGKPVIYLYPTKDTLVNVTLTIPGTITESIPTYPRNGWQNILAHPNGELAYQGNMYHELYYESAVDAITPPATGIIIPVNNLQQELVSITAHLGLLPIEQQEFLDYWIPKLVNLHSPYILVSLFDTTEKERLDHITITPNPDTRIEYLFYFKPLSTQNYSIAPLTLPAFSPKRIGFTEVEWGGTISM